jgi:queuine/archaeosine tRNA-ribosyltransferase
MGTPTEGQHTRQRCVVIFASEDDELARKLVAAIDAIGFEGWSSHRIAQGQWNVKVDEVLRSCAAVVPLVTRHTRLKQIFNDEWQTAVRHGRPIFPFTLDPTGTPLGFGQYSRTDAASWDGTPQDPAITALGQRLKAELGANQHIGVASRLASLSLDAKQLALPAFVYSLSSFETQLDPRDGLELMSGFKPPGCLVSAYDVHKYLETRDRSFKRSISALMSDSTLLFLDSGNYEATRRGDHRTKSNANGWSPEKFWEVAATLPAHVVFSYDPPVGDHKFRGISDVVADIEARYIRDLMRTGLECSQLCPIVHIPRNLRLVEGIAETLVYETAKALQPTFVAIPERELGDGIRGRMRTVKAIRRRLGDLGRYQPLHILGAGNPISIAALAACGGDSFDGLEWCRTAANFETNNLMHFQQFDLLVANFGGRIRNEAARGIAEMGGAAFALRVASYNYDYFDVWMETVRHWVHSPLAAQLLKTIPTFGSSLAEEYLR